MVQFIHSPRLFKVFEFFNLSHVAITLGPLVLTKYLQVADTLRRHEIEHVKQWLEVTVVALAIYCAIWHFIGQFPGWGWLVAAAFSFYLYYASFHLMNMLVYDMTWDEAYDANPFEIMATKAEDEGYKRKLFNWMSVPDPKDED